MKPKNRHQPFSMSWWNGTPDWFKSWFGDAANNPADLREFKNVLQRSSNTIQDALLEVRERLYMTPQEAAKRYGEVPE